ncbi:restriction endonuclease subunit S [Streptococcus suis]|uniref:Type I restriction enzyme, S subunit n=1 Tax=Streptococcus suis TaxID=1307 RepID=A0A0Z8G4X8_STRSU|nr:restriction endonuclease subunit S [Streptococcus suis]CYU92238.1 type I restriction enzyme%2C S subunit [Streptococcus suis]
MKTSNNIPAYRFQGYTDAWELRKLGEVARFRRGSFPQPYGNSEWYDGDGAMPFVQVADVTDEMNLVGDTKQKISRKAQPLSVFAEEGSVLVTLQGSIGRVAITQYEAFIDRTVLIFENFNLPVDNLFWAYIIKQKFIEEAKCAPGGTIKTITKEVLSDFDIKLPSHPEQSAIGSFFSTLDRQITLHQRKLDTLKEQKMTYLKLLFPAKGQTKPALRFQGFEDDWEEVKLGEVLEERNVQQLPQEDTPLVSFTVENGVTPKTDRYDREFLVRTGDKKYKYTELDDIVYNPANLKFGAISRNKFGKAVFSPIYVTLVVNKSKVFANFIEGIVTKRDFIQEALQFQEGTVYERMAVKVSDFLLMKITLPTLPEQEVIGTFFQTLDQEIAQVEDKLASLKEMKKTLLRKLFV